jgi:L-2-hydroxyglutarate oxidase LhgO
MRQSLTGVPSNRRKTGTRSGTGTVTEDPENQAYKQRPQPQGLRPFLVPSFQVIRFDRSNSIIEMLLTEANEAGVEIRCGSIVRSVEKKELFEVETNNGTIVSPSLVVATGGLSK